MNFELPSKVLLRLTYEIDEYTPYILLSIQKKDRNTWKASVYSYPFRVLKNGFWKEDAIEFSPCIYSFEKEEQKMETKIWRTKRYISFPNENIHEFMMLKPSIVLPKEVSYVSRKLDTEKKWHFNIQDVEWSKRDTILHRPIQTQRNTQIHEKAKIEEKGKAKINTIPNHVLLAFVELSESKKEQCPITMDPIHRSTAGYTPCGHLFTYSALVEALSKKGICPTCRTEIHVENIQKVI